jgi:transcription elongation factor GreA
MNAIEEEIKDIRYILSVSIPEELNAALEFGDADDNSELSEILSRQYYLSVRLNQLINRLEEAEVVDCSKLPTDRVHLGSRVTVQNATTGEILKFFITKTVESFDDVPYQEYLVVTAKSPIGKAILNKKTSDQVHVKLPSASVTFIILDFLTVHDT